MQVYLAARPAYHRTHPRMFDTECLHTPYLPPPTPGPHGISSLSAHRNSPRLKPASGAGHVPEGDLLNLGNDYSFGAAAAHKRATSPSRSNQNQNQNQSPSPNELKRRPGFSKRPGSGRKKSASGSTTTKDSTAADGMTDSEREEDDDLEEEWIPDVFLFEYGCVVLWGMTEKEEKKFLASMCVFSIQSSRTRELMKWVTERGLRLRDYQQKTSRWRTSISTMPTTLGMSFSLSPRPFADLFKYI